MTHARHLMILVSSICGLALFAACGNDDGPGDTDNTEATRPQNTGAACQAAADCYPNTDATLIQGEIRCLDRVRDGYCTHLCETDDDCCAAPGECTEGTEQVCSPFESTELTMCFLSCEEQDLVPAPGSNAIEPVDENEYCQREAGTEFICRSSGGGRDNRRICVPGNCGVGSACETDADCTGDLSCLKDFRGGYCGLEGCSGNADCPEGSACVRHTNGTQYCWLVCERDADCSFCRWDGTVSQCTADVEFVEPGDATVCQPVAR